MLVLEGFQLPVEGVVLGVGDLRRVIDVVAAVVVEDLLAQILYPAPNVYASCHAGIIRTEPPAPKGRSITDARPDCKLRRSACLPASEYAASGGEGRTELARAVLGLAHTTGGSGNREVPVRRFEIGEEPVYLVADDLLALQERVADALDHGALLAQEVLYLLAGFCEDAVRLLAHLTIAQQGAYRGARHLVGERTEGVESLAHPEEADHRRRRPGRLLQIPAHARRRFAEVDVLGRPRRKRRLYAGHHVRAGADVPLLALQVPGGDRVARFVGGDLDLLLLVVLHGLLEADLIRQLRRPDVLPP